MNGLNRAIIAGNLCADGELRYTNSGQPVLNLRVATNERYRPKDSDEWQTRTDYHNVTVWGKRGESLAKFLTKGSPILVEGSIRTSSYDDKEGNKRYKTEINAKEVVLLSNGRDGRTASDAEGGDASFDPESYND